MTSQSKFPPELKAVKYNGVGTQLTEGLSEQLGVSFLRTMPVNSNPPVG